MKHNVGRIILPDGAGVPFARVPSWVFSLRVSEQARLLLAWAAGRPPGWIPQVRDICETLHFGPDKWRRLVAELSALDVISQFHSREGGRTTHSLIIDLRPVLPESLQSQRVARDERVLQDESLKNRGSGERGKVRRSELEGVEKKVSSVPIWRNKLGWQLRHPRLGLLTVYGEAGHWLSERGVIVGDDAKKIWGQVRQGEFDLTPPALPDAIRQLMPAGQQVGIK